MNSKPESLKRTNAFLNKFTACLLAFDLLFFAFLLWNYLQSRQNLDSLVGSIGQIFLVSSLWIGTLNAPSPQKTRAKNVAIFTLLVCSFMTLAIQSRLK